MSILVKFENFQNILDGLTTTLEDYSGPLTVFPEIQEKLETEVPFDFAGAKGSVAGKGSIEVFNSKDDKDSDSVIGDTSGDVGDVALKPSINYTPNKCWIKYTVQASLKGTASQTIDDLAIGIDGNSEIKLLDYHTHAPTSLLPLTLGQDVQNFRLITDVEDILSLKPQEAVALDANAKLTVKAEFKWSDVLAQSMSKLSDLLDQGELLNLKIDASVTAKLSVSIEGGFKLVFSRDQNVEDKVRVAFKKSSGYDFSAGFGAKISAELTNAEDFEKVYTASVTSIFGKATDYIEEIKEVASVNSLPEPIQQYAEDLIDRLGVDDLDQLKTKIEDIESKLTGIIKEAAKSKAELSFAYEYERIATHESLCELSVNDERLSDIHQMAISANVLDITPLIDNSTIILHRFFYQDSTTIKSSWGFNLGFGKWSAFSSTYSELKFVESRNAQGQKKLATVGIRGYKDKWGSDKRNFYINFEANMAVFTDQNIVPKVSDFELGLSIVHTFETNELSKDEAIEVIDQAAVWGIVQTDDTDEQIDDLYKVVSGGTDVKVVSNLIIGAKVFPKLLSILSQGDQNRVAKALAAALPRASRILQVRATPSLREQYYAPIFKQIVAGGLSNPDAISQAARNYIRSKGHVKAGRQEARWRRAASRNDLLGGVIYLHPSMRNDVWNLTKGMSRLSEAYESSLSYRKIKPSYNLFDDMGEHAFYNRFFANYLLKCCKAAGLAKSDIECSVKIEYKKDGQEKEIILS